MNAPHAPWAGNILHIDLTSGHIDTIPTMNYGRDYLGGRGLAARLAWDMIPPGVGALDEGNPLMLMTGALVGTPAPSSGRVTVCGLSPQAHPDEWYTRANLGGHWGPELKFAGYDGLIVTGKSPVPVVIVIEDDRVEIRPAADLWGLGLVETQKRMISELGPAWRVVAIGPAGEHRCRYAIVATNTESAAGQGGYGAVMGSKNLKAIAVRGHGGISVAKPRETLRRARLISQAVRKRYGNTPLPKPSDAPYSARRRPTPCTYQCPGGCGSFYENVPGTIHKDRSYSGQIFCCAPGFRGVFWPGIEISFAASFEIAQLCNDLGLNHWEFIFGLGPWIARCQERGELTHLGGTRIDLADPAFWVDMIHRVAYREGWGDILAEGGPRAASILSTGEDIIQEYYPAWGQASHWDGHGSFSSPYYPYWLVTSLQWAMDTRDPMGGGHGFTTNIFGLVRRLGERIDEPEVREALLALGQRLYGTPDATDPHSHHEGKAEPGIYHQDRGALKDCLGICDNIFPMLADPNEPDYVLRTDEVEGRYMEHYLYETIADEPLSREAFYRVGTRVFTMERLIAIRNWGRSRATDETIIPYLDHPEKSVNPTIGEALPFSTAAYRCMLDTFYELRGWDPRTGHPLPETLAILGLEHTTSAREPAAAAN